MTEVSYVPGGRTAIAVDGCWLLVDAPPDSAAVHEIWQLMEQAPRLEALIAGILRLGFENLPDFALLAAEPGRHHLICRGEVCATLMAQGTPICLDGTGLATWREHPVGTGVERVILGDPPSDADLRLPASAGIFLAASITVALAARSLGNADATLVHAAAASAPVQARPITSDEISGNVPDAEVMQDTGYDFLFAATRARTVEDAAVRPAADADVPPWPSVTSWPEPQPSPSPSPEPLPQPDAAADAGTDDSFAPHGLIDAVPWVCEPRRAPDSPSAAHGHRHRATPSQGAAADPDHAPTVRRADLQKPAPRAAAPDRIGPTVHALLCPRSHPNPPSSSSCRLCGATLPQQDPAVVPRPVLGVLRLSTGDVITLDRGVVMGRSPTTDFVGEERPHVVKLPGGDGEISRTHLLVSLDGWHVLVTDLKSTNGTLVGLPGREPEQLRPGEPLPIQPGTLVTLADGIDFRYEVAE